MKSMKKQLTLAIAACMLISISVFGTVAWLTSTADVTNTFTVGNVAISMDETNVDNGEDATGEVPERDTENTYKLMPGGIYEKDPLIKVKAGSEPCYVFVKIDNQLGEVESTVTAETIATQMADLGWKPVLGAPTGYFQYTGDLSDNGVVTATEEVAIHVFDQLHIEDTASNDDLAEVAGKEILVEAFAIQSEGFESDVDAAFEEVTGETIAG